MKTYNKLLNTLRFRDGHGKVIARMVPNGLELTVEVPRRKPVVAIVSRMFICNAYRLVVGTDK